jgi:hypothetical protein
MNQNKNSNSLRVQGFSNPGALRKTPEDTLLKIPFADMTLVIEHDDENLADCVGLLMWQGNSNHPFEAKKFCRMALPPDVAVVLGKKLQELGELVITKKEFQKSVSTDG